MSIANYADPTGCEIMEEKGPMSVHALEFSKKYTPEHAREYHAKHRRTLGRRLSNLREQQMAAWALSLAGDPVSVLDLPCGTGRFWNQLAGKQDRILLAADNSGAMLSVAQSVHPVELLERIQLFPCSAFDIALRDASVDHVFCMRLLHHVVRRADRLAILKEFYRVTRETVALSLWVGGNYKALRRRRLEARRTHKPYQNRVVLETAVVEREFAEVGFTIVGHSDFLKFYAMWRVYVLQKQAARRP
jgi:SAM-dependent methyltransferase